jgi:hypothetical protein
MKAFRNNSMFLQNILRNGQKGEFLSCGMTSCGAAPGIVVESPQSRMLSGRGLGTDSPPECLNSYLQFYAFLTTNYQSTNPNLPPFAALRLPTGVVTVAICTVTAVIVKVAALARSL